MLQTEMFQGLLAPFLTCTGYLVEVYFDVRSAALRIRPHASNDPSKVHLEWNIAFPYSLRTIAGEVYAVQWLIPVQHRHYYKIRGCIRRQRDGALFDHRGRPVASLGENP